MWKRLRAILRKEFLHLRYDSLSLKLLIVMPVVQLLLIGPALNKEVSHIAYVVLDADHSLESSELQQSFATHPRFDFAGSVENREGLDAALRAGHAMVALEIPAGFASRLDAALDMGTGESADTASIQLLLDGQDATTAMIAAGYAQAIVNSWVNGRLTRQVMADGRDLEELVPVRIQDRILFNPVLNSSWYMVPGMAAMLVTMVIALAASFSVVREREAGTLEQLLVTPAGVAEILMGKLIPYWLVGTLEFMFALAVARLGFDIPLAGSFVDLFLLVGLYSLATVALGLWISTLVNSQQQALFLIYFFMVFFILTSGFLMPVESMPAWTQAVTQVNATQHFLLGIREVMLRGAGISALTGELGKIAAIALGLLAWTGIRFQRSST